MSFLPEKFAHPYEINPDFSKSVAYFSSEFAIDQSLKIYSGGLGFLAGSHMRSAHDLKQNLVGVGILWSYGYYNQVRGDDRQMAVALRRKSYHFLRDTGVKFTINIQGKDVWVKGLYLPGDIFGTCPMFFVTTDFEDNDDDARDISRRLYDSDHQRRIAQYMLLGIGGAKLLDELGAQPDIYHLNEAHALSAAFYLHSKGDKKEELRKKLIFTTHTPEAAGNEHHDFNELERFGFFCGADRANVEEFTGIRDDSFSHSLAALRLARISNGVSKLHGEVSRKMWGGFDDICEITHITNAQNKKYWVDAELESARVKADKKELSRRKHDLKEKLFKTVADQTGKIFDPEVLTVVWARRFAGYKRADLIATDLERFTALLSDQSRPVQIIWAGKPYPRDYGAIETFNRLIEITEPLKNATVLVGYELELSRLMKSGADVWLNNPVVTREASGTSGMTASMNGAVNLSTYDGWVCEYAKDGHNSFIVPPADPSCTPEARDQHDLNSLYHILDNKIKPAYYDRPDDWWQLVLNSMDDVVPFFDSDRMATEYYEKLFNA
ncbi:MAG: alpha-glucan family phosphorylase [Verrucomicrobiaceae bacterium]